MNARWVGWGWRLLALGCVGAVAACGPSAGSVVSSAMGSGIQTEGGSTTWAGLAACSRAILWGDVVSSVPAPQTGRIVVTLDVTDWVKPSTGPAKVEYDLVDPEANGGKGVNRPFVAGEHMLLRVPLDSKEMVTGHYGDDAAFQGGELQKALPKAPNGCGPDLPGG